ncbi:MAG: excisionase family DNA-binding protein [Eggerthellaceae bacterium]|nr:excisionase family DNA-binding protein [Eggerthellaceae bacterium]
MKTDHMLTLREASVVMRCSYSKALKIAKRGELPFVQLGSTWFIPESKLFEALGLTRKEA